MLACRAGYYSSISGSVVCQSCPIGSVSTVASSVCTTCPAGTYSTFWKAYGGYPTTICFNCAAGSVSLPGSSSCTQCPPGFTSSGQGDATCTSCPAGYFLDISNFQCTFCSEGYYAPFPGMTQCLQCSVGTYVNSYPSTYCSLAEIGTYVEFVGSAYISNCPTAKHSGAATCYSFDLPSDDDSPTLGCPVGQYRNSMDSQCIEVVAGFSSPEDDDNVYICDAGSYSNNGAAACTPCAATQLAGGAQCQLGLCVFLLHE